MSSTGMELHNLYIRSQKLFILDSEGLSLSANQRNKQDTGIGLFGKIISGMIILLLMLI
mgnify:CR=1 FL=1